MEEARVAMTDTEGPLTSTHPQPLSPRHLFPPRNQEGWPASPKVPLLVWVSWHAASQHGQKSAEDRGLWASPNFLLKRAKIFEHRSLLVSAQFYQDPETTDRRGREGGLGTTPVPTATTSTVLIFKAFLIKAMGFPGGSMVENPPAMQKMQIQSLGREDPLEEEGQLQYPCLENPMDREAWRLQRVRHDWLTEHVCLMAPWYQAVTVYTRYLILNRHSQCDHHSLLSFWKIPFQVPCHSQQR